MELQELKNKLDKFYGFDISTKSRVSKYVKARSVYYKIITTQLLGYTFESIGKSIGRNHATVIHGLKTFEGYYLIDIHFKKTYHQFLNDLNDTDFIAIEPVNNEEIEELKKQYQKKIIDLQCRIHNLEKQNKHANNTHVDFKPLFELNDKEVLDFIETRLKPYLNMIKSKKMHKEIIEVVGARLR